MEEMHGDWRRSQLGPGGDAPRGGDLGMQDERGYKDYDQAALQEDSSNRLGRAPSSSVGPWDSASQRSVNEYPLPFPTSTPIAGTETGDGRRLKNKSSYGGLSYIDEEGAYYHSNSARPASELLDGGYGYNNNRPEDMEMRGLVHDAAHMGGKDVEDGNKLYGGQYNDVPYNYSPMENSNTAGMKEPSHLYSLLLFPTGLDRLLALFGLNVGRFPIEQAIERKRHGLPGQRFPVAAWTLALGKCFML